MTVTHGDLWAVCHQYPERPPILSVTLGGIHLTLTADKDSDDRPVDELVRAVEAYAAALDEWRQRSKGCGCGRPVVTA